MLQIWAYANLGHPPGDALANAIAGAAIRSLSSFTAQNVSNTLWAYAKLEFPHERLLRDSALHAQRILHQFQPQSIANMVGL